MGVRGRCIESRDGVVSLPLHHRRVRQRQEQQEQYRRRVDLGACLARGADLQEELVAWEEVRVVRRRGVLREGRLA